MNTSFETGAKRLREAYRSGPIEPLRDLFDVTDVEAAYAVQSINTQFWVDQGRRMVGRKIGLTSPAVQRQLGVMQPDFGVLFDDMQVFDGGLLEAGSVRQGKVEAEVALLLGHDLVKPDIGFHQVAAAVEYVVPAIEIVDSRVANWQISFADTVADNASSAYFVLGQEIRSLHGLDLRTCGMVLEINGEVVSVGAGAACLGHPLEAATWLARMMIRCGAPLRAGDIVLTGALGPMVALEKGAVVRATIGGLGTVCFTYGKDPV